MTVGVGPVALGDKLQGLCTAWTETERGQSLWNVWYVGSLLVELLDSRAHRGQDS